MLQQSSGPLSQNLDFHYVPGSGDLDLGVHTRFHFLGDERKFLASLDTKMISDGFVYLHIGADAKDDTVNYQLAAARYAELKSGQPALVKFEDIFEEEKYRSEHMNALEYNAQISRREMNKYLLAEAMTEARKEAAALFNLTAPQMERLIVRFDYFFQVAQQKLRNKGAAGAIEITFTGTPDPLFFKSLKDLMKNHSGT